MYTAHEQFSALMRMIQNWFWSFFKLKCSLLFDHLSTHYTCETHSGQEKTCTNAHKNCMHYKMHAHTHNCTSHSFCFQTLLCVWFLFGFIKGISIWKGVRPCPIAGFSVCLWEKKIFIGNVTSEIWLRSFPL